MVQPVKVPLEQSWKLKETFSEPPQRFKPQIIINREIK